MRRGFMAGAAQRYLELRDREMDAEQRQKELMFEILERRKTQVLPILLERMQAKNEAAAQKTGRIDEAVNRYGFSKNAATALELSGQLQYELAKLDSLGNKVSTTYIRDLTQALEKKITNNEQLAKAVAAGINTDQTTQEGIAEGYMKALNANTMEDFMSAAMSLTPTSDGTAFQAQRFEYQPLKGAGIETTERDRIQKQLKTSLSNLYNDAFMTNDAGELVFRQEGETDVSRLFDDLVKQTSDLAESPFTPYNPASALDYVIGKINTADNVPASKVREHLPTALASEIFDWSEYATPNSNNNNNNNNRPDLG